MHSEVDYDCHYEQRARKKVMKRIVITSLVTSFLLIGLVGLFLLVGFMQDPKFVGSSSEWINAQPEEIWDYLTAVEDIPNRRREVVKIEILKKDGFGNPIQWKETPDMGGYMIFESEMYEKPKLWKVRLSDSSFKMLGTWTYELTPKNNGTLFEVTEESEIFNITVRGAYFLSGRDATLQKELEMIRNRFSGR
ncbi:SRPBCC family protein [Leptospira sp. 96542]|nr:SRPBCC family protein [Leptospira sp. 96542]